MTQTVSGDDGVDVLELLALQQLIQLDQVRNNVPGLQSDGSQAFREIIRTCSHRFQFPSIAVEDFKTNGFPLCLDLPEGDASVCDLESLGPEVFIGAFISLLLGVLFSKLNDSSLAGEHVVRVESSGAHVKPLLLLPPPLLLHIIYTNRFKMKKLEIREESSQHHEAERESSEDSEELRDQPTALEFVSKIKKKEAMFINYQGVFETATSSYQHSLALMYTAIAEEGWKVTHGQNTGISQHAGQGDRGFVWNMPFEITYEVRKMQGWPQMAIVLYGKDYMGRSVARGYGNFHLPAGEGSHARKVRIFEAVPPSTAATCCAYLMGYINELKTPEKVLLGAEGGREYLKTRPIGEVTVRVDVRRYNFDRNGYE